MKQAKKLLRKSLSVFLAMVMMMTSMSVCFTTISYAADNGATDAQWNTLAAALKVEAVKNASFTGDKYNKTVVDPDGTLIDAIEAWWVVFNAIKEDVGNDASFNSYRTAPQVNAKISAKLSTMMGGNDFANYKVANFLSGVIAGVTESDIASGVSSGREDKNQNASVSTDLAPATDIVLNVQLAGVLSYDSVDDLPDEKLATTKTFTIKHRNTNYDKGTTIKNESDGCGGTEKVTYHTWKYYYVISDVSATEGNYQDTKVLKTSKATLDSYSEYITATVGQLVLKMLDNETETAAAYTAVNTAKTNVEKFNPNAWTKYFSAYDVATFNKNYSLASEIVAVGEVVYPLTLLKEAGYNGMDKDALDALYAKLTAGLKTFDTASQDARAFIEANKYSDGTREVEFKRADIQAFADEVLREIHLIELRALKVTIDNTIPAYDTYNEDNVISGAVSGATLSTAKGTVDGFIKSLNSYPANLVNNVMPGYKDALSTLSADLAYLIKTADYDDQFSAKYAQYVAEVYSATDLNADSATLVAALKGEETNYDAWYTGLKNLIAAIEADLEPGTADKILQELDDEMKERMDAVYTTLHARVDAQLDNVTVLYAAVKALNGSIDILNINNYSKYKQAYNTLDRDTYDFLMATSNFTMPQETIDKFNALSGDFAILDNFLATGGFNTFSQILGEYVNRDVLANDLIRENEYVVDKAKVENVINSVDSMISDPTIAKLLGGLLNEDGSSLDLAGMLKGMVKDMLYTDAFINTIVGALYPMILEALINVWEKDLPNAGKDMDQDLANIIKKDLYTIVGDTGLSLYPDQLATALSNIDKTKYADAINKLKTGVKTYQINGKTYEEDDPEKVASVDIAWTPWNKEGSAFLNEDGTLNIVWGIDALKEAGASETDVENKFYEVFDDALTSLVPLFHALLASKGCTLKSEDAANYIVDADLLLKASGNAGYANLLVPLYELLGADFESVSTFEAYANQANSLDLMLRAILKPVFGIIDKVAEAPLATVIGILPNLCYALSMQMLTPLLNMLGTTITVAADAGRLANAIVNSCDSIKLDLDNLYSLNLSIGDLLGDINDLIDLSDGVNSLLKLLGVELPAIDQGKIAQMGTLTKITSQRKATIYDKAAIKEQTDIELGTNEALTIVADKGAVGNYLLTYIFNVINDEEAFKGLLGLLMTVEDEAGNTSPDTAKIEETVASFKEMGLFSYGTGNAVAAVVELFNQETFPYFNYTWYNDPMFDGTVQNLSPAMVSYLSYDNDLTRPKADYIVDHLDELISSIIDQVNGNPEGTYSIAAKLDELIGGLFTNETVTKLAKALGALDLNALLAGGAEEAEAPAIDIAALVKDILGIDLSAFARYKDIADDTDWGVTDAATFATAVADILEPLAPLVNFILKDEDITAFTYTENVETEGEETESVVTKHALTLKGYNGYDSAIVPLLVALGIDAPVLNAEDDAVAVILGAIVTKLEAITGEGADAVQGLADLLPGVLYYLQSNALATAVNNLLIPVYAILDTIRPIYDLDLDELLGSLLGDLPITLDLNNLDVNFVLNLVKDLVGLDFTGLAPVIADVCKVAVVDHDYGALVGEGKKGAYTNLFNDTDLVAVILNFAFDWCTVDANVDALAAVIGGEDTALVEKVKYYIANIYTIIDGKVITEEDYANVEWDYNFPEGYNAENVIFASGISIQPTIASLTYPTDWTEDTAKYLDENLDAIVASILNLANVEGDLSTLLKDMLGGVLTGANLNKIVTMLTDLLDKLNAEIINNAGVLIGADVDALRAYKADEEKTYTTVEFAQELATILSVIPEVVNLVFFNDNFEIFNYADGESVGTIYGAYGYAKGLAPILEALGCKNLPAKDSKDVEAVLVSLANRIDEILDDPINEILNVLPNVIYFLNANGISASLANTVVAVTSFMGLLKESFGVDVDLIKIINDALNGLLPEDSNAVINVLNFDLENVFILVQELTNLNLAPISDLLVDLCVGKIEPFVSVSGDYGFRMIYNDDYARYDMITILVTAALLVIADEDNAAKLDKMLGTDVLSALKDVFAGKPVEYTAINWDYPLAANGTVDTMKYAITYPNNWTEDTAIYITNNLPVYGDKIANLVDNNYDSLAALLGDKVNIYSSANIQAIVDAIAGLLKDIDNTLLAAAGQLLDVDIVGLAAYTAPEGIDTAEEFAAELANVLNTYAKGIVEWALFGKDMRFFVDETKVGDEYEVGEDIIVINGGHGYAEGLALILEALGCEDLPKVYNVNDFDSKAAVEDILSIAFARLDAILANPVEEIFNILPNVLYFLNANGVAVAFDNLTAAVVILLDKLSAFGINLDLNELLDLKKLLKIEDKDVDISIDNLTVDAVLDLVSALTDLDVTILKEVLVGFALGQVNEYDSVSKFTAKKMTYATEFDKHDMVTVIATMALLLIADEENAAVLDKMIGTDIISGLQDVFADIPVKYVDIDWDYALAENGTVDVMKYAITYPNNWTEDTAVYITNNLPAYGDKIANLVDKNYDSLAALLGDKVNIYSSANIQAIVDAVAGFLKDIDATLLDVAGVLLDVDLEGLLAYTAPEGIDTAEEFADELADVLSTYAQGVVEWAFFGRDFRFFVDEAAASSTSDTIVINGGHGYAEGLALILEALGCEDLPKVYEDEDFDSAVALKQILNITFARLDAILANPVEEIFNILPNVLYFLNANGVAYAFDNLTAAVVILLDKLSAFGINLDLNELLDLKKLLKIEDKDVDISIDNLTVDAVLDLVSALTDLDVTILKQVLVGFALGQINEYDSVSSKPAYKMTYETEFDKHDMVTVIATMALLLIADDANAARLDEMLKLDVISGLQGVFADIPVQYAAPDWDYCWAEDGIDYTNNTVTVMKKAITYPNNWTEESAKYVADNLGPIGDLVASLIDSNYVSLAALLADKVKIYSSANIQAIVDAVAGFLKDIDATLLDVAGVLLDVDLEGLLAYTAPEGIDTAEEFADELANVLSTYAHGVVEWAFFGKDFRFFVDEAEASATSDVIVLNGGQGYAEGLALILEALGCEDLPAVYGVENFDSAAALKAIFNSVFARVDEIFADPANEVFELLPNLLYFLNANGVSIAFNNMTAAVDILLEKLAALGVDLSIDSLINLKKLLDLEDTDAAISLDNLTVAAIIEVLAIKTGLDARLLNDVLVGFALGEVTQYESVSTYSVTYKMGYNDEFAKYDMITVLANLVVMIAEDEANAAVLKDILGADIYQLLLNIFNMSEVPVQDFNWAFTEYADTGYVFSALATSELFADFVYGPLYTEEMAQYIADNFGDFIDNLIYLLGIQIDGINVNSLQELINGLINGNLYNSENIIAIRDALAGVAESIGNVKGGEHIKAILKTSLGVDIDALVNYEVAEFTNDRAQFTTALCELLEPIFPLLKWLLANEDITFFLDEEGYDAITLFGAEGYAYGIIPLLEVLDCDGILTKDSYYAQVANDDSVLLTSILNPLFNRLDEIMLDPATEIFAMLPNIIYFINSNGLDTVVKNTLNAVYAVFNAIEPIAKIDLYEMLGIRLDEVNMNTLIELAFDMIAESTGYEFELVDFNAILELTTGKLESYYSANGKLAYRMVYTDMDGVEGGTTAEMVTIILRLLVEFINRSENGEKVLDLLQSEMGMSDDARTYVGALFAAIQYGMGETDRGIDASLATLYYVFYGLDIGVEEANGILKDINKEWEKILNDLGKSDDPNELTIGNLLAAALDMYMDGIFDEGGLASDGLIKFFRNLIELIKNIINWFKNLFS